MTPYYERNGVVLHHGDTREVLSELETASADLLLTDPPYGMGYTSKTGTVRSDGRWQGIRLFRSTLLDVDRILCEPAHVYVFCHWESWPEFYDAAGSFWKLKNALIWSKGNHGPGDCFGDYGHDYEVILFGHKGRRRLNDGRDLSVRHHPTLPPSKRFHPTQKPAELLRFYVEKSTDPGELVLDPFAGSGATLRAAAAAGRRAVGIELDERYCEQAAETLDRLFDAIAAGDPVVLV